MTELMWEGKYDKEARKVAPLRVALPFQTVETVNESAQERQRSLDLFSTGRDAAWRNRLIWGDKKYVLPALAAELAGMVDLIYIDPPFATGDDFSFTARVPDADDGGDPEAAGIFTKQPSLIEQKAYRDTWGVSAEARARGATSTDAYVRWFYEGVVLLHELLSNRGSIYVHLDWRVVHHARMVLDEVFGPDRFMSEIVWKRTIGATSIADRYRTQTDSLLVYTKSDSYTFNEQFSKERLTPEEIDAKFPLVDAQRGRYCIDNLANPDFRPTLMYEYKGYKPPAKGWAISLEKMKQWDEEGRLHFPEDRSQRIRRKRFLSEWQGSPVQNLWDDIPPLQSRAGERTGYATQKPEALLERVVKASSNPGALILDCFCGSGTTPAVAERLERRWIAADLGRFAIHTTRKRLLGIDGVRPFCVQNLGKYERQLWQAAEFGEGAQARTVAYRRFILDVYKSKCIEGYAWLHGVKQGRMVHVGTVDAPVTVGDVKQIAAEFGKAVGTGADAPTTRALDVLGWDFAFELNELAKQTAERAGLDVRFLRIPREVLDKRAVEQGDVRFFELAALGVEVKRRGRTVTVRLSDFMIPTDDVPEEVQRAITDWSQWIDYWAVDWDNRGDTFHNEWQTYRTRKEPALRKSAVHEYDAAGSYQVVVKVIDILGNDTTKTLKVEVP
jgi:adenine-specific DNA-methyltransferase